MATEALVSTESTPPTAKTHKKMTVVTPDMLRLFRNLNNKGTSNHDMAQQCGVGISTIGRWKGFAKKGVLDAYLEKVKNGDQRGKYPSTTNALAVTARHAVRVTPLPEMPARLRPGLKATQMKAEGMNTKQIAAKLRLSVPQVYYWLKQWDNFQHRATNPLEGETNGVSRVINKDILIGFSWAETERFLANISERIGIPTQILRRRIPELLAATPMRK